MDATVDNTVNVATVNNVAGLSASVSNTAGGLATVSFSSPIGVVVSPTQNINLITVSGPIGPMGPQGSGVANLTGQYPIFYDAGSGIVGIVSGYYATFSELTGASGALVAQISAASAGVNALNGLSGFVDISAINPLFLSIVGQTIYLSGSGLATSGDVSNLYGSINTVSGNLQLTGSYLYNLITGNTGQGGLLTTGVTSLNGRSGDIQLTGAGNISILVDGQIITVSGLNSGEVSQAQLDALSGYVNDQDYATGQTLISYVNSASGGLQNQIDTLPTASQLAQTGFDLYLLITGLSGQSALDYATQTQLTTTGQTLYNLLVNGSGQILGVVATTGQQAWTAADNNGINLSGNLQLTGSNLQTQIDQITAVTGIIPSNIVYTSGLQFISGTKYFLGNTYIDNLFVTGSQTVIHTQDVYISDNWLILNATGGARDSAIFIATGFTGIAATGAVIGWDIPSNSWRFGLASQQTDLITLPRIASGEAVDEINVKVASLSGFSINFSGVLQGEINELYPQSNPSGYITGISTGDFVTRSETGQFASVIALYQTGSNLSNRINSLSGYSETTYVHRTGNETVSGIKVFISNTYVSGGTNTHLRYGSSSLQYLRTNGRSSIIDFENEFIRSQGGNNVTVNWGTQKLYEAGGGQETVDWSGCFLSMPNGAKTVNWRNGWLSGEWLTNTVGIESGSLVNYFRLVALSGALINSQTNSLTLASNYSVIGGEPRIYCDNINPITISFPSAIIFSGLLVNVKLINTGTVMLTGILNQTFDGSLSYQVVGQYSARQIHSNGANWFIW